MHAEALAELDVLVADLVEVFGELLLAGEVVEGDGHRVGDGEREFQVVRVRRLRGVGRIQVNHAEDFAFAADGSADDAGGEDVALRVAAAELAVVHHVAGEHGLAVAHHRGGEELRDAVVAMGRIAAGGNDFEAVRRLLVRRGAGAEQHCAGVDLRALEEAVESAVREGDDVAGFGELEGEAAKIGGGAADLRKLDVDSSLSSGRSVSSRLCSRRWVIVVGS